MKLLQPHRLLRRIEHTYFGGTYVSLIDSAHMSSDFPSKIEIVRDRARWTAVCRDQLPPLGDPFLEG